MNFRHLCQQRSDYPGHGSGKGAASGDSTLTALSRRLPEEFSEGGSNRGSVFGTEDLRSRYPQT